MGIESNQDTEFEEFEKAGEVEVGDANAGVEETEDGKKPAAKRGPPKPAAKPAAAEDDEGDDVAGEGDDEGEDEPKPKKTAAEHQIERLKREKRDLQKQLREGGVNGNISQRLQNIESRLT